MKRPRNLQQSEKTLTLKQLLTGPKVQTHGGVVFERISKAGRDHNRFQRALDVAAEEVQPG